MDDLIRALNSDDEAERLYAVEDMSEAGDTKMAVLLVERLAKEASQAVKDSIVFALKRMDCSEAYGMLFDMFTSPEAFLRNAAMVIFGAGNGSALYYLGSRLDHSDKEVRKLMLDAIFEIGTPEARLAIRALLNDDAPNVRITAVEYLGRLNDRESLEDIISLLESDPEPMLRVTILETISKIGSNDHIKQAMEILVPGGDIKNIDPLYLPEVTRFVGRSGELEDIRKLLDNIDDIRAYSENIIEMIGETIKRFEGDAVCKEVLDKLKAVAEDRWVREEVRIQAAEYLLNDAFSGVSPDMIYDLGERFLCDGINYSGIKLLAGSGMSGAEERIKAFMDNTDDEDLRDLCMELVGE